jgi:hypothetical protein
MFDTFIDRQVTVRPKREASIPTRPYLRFGVATLLGALTIIIAGCTKTPEARPDGQVDTTTPRPSRPPFLVVIGNRELVDVVGREWKARTGQKLNMEAWEEILFQKVLTTGNWPDPKPDGVIYPSMYLGTLLDQNQILAAPSYVRADDGSSSGLSESDIFPVLRTATVDFQGSVVALPLSSLPFAMCYRGELPQSVGTRAPATWGELTDLAARLRDRRASTDESAMQVRILAQPLARHWSARTFLQRVAAYVREPTRISDLFEYGSMRPLISERPFVRALEELVNDEREYGDSSRPLTGPDVWREVTSGRAFVGIGAWPNRPQDNERDLQRAANVANLIMSPCPGSMEIYSVVDERWQTRPSIATPTLLTGREFVASVMKGTRRQRATWHVLTRLSSRELNAIVSVQSGLGGPIRFSQLAQVSSWLGGSAGSSLLESIPTMFRTQFSSNLLLVSPQLPRSWQYLDGLDEAVRSAVAGDITPKDALTVLARQWDEALERYGRDQAQKVHFRSAE